MANLNLRTLNPQTLASLIPRPIPSNPKTKEYVEQILKHGYVVIPNCFSRAEAEEAKAEIIRLSGKEPWTGRNDFEGHRTNRIFALPNKSRLFDKFYILPQVLALNDYFLEPDYLMYVIQSIVINPGEGQQIVHHDDSTTKLPRPRAPVSAAIMVVFDDYTDINGATKIIPGSHLWGNEPRPDKKSTISITCPAGSVIYFLGTTYHSGGPNRSDMPRHALTVQYCQPYIRPLEDLILSVDPRKLGDIPEKVVDMMGYKSGFPFLGSGKFTDRKYDINLHDELNFARPVDGLNPRKGMQRMMRWLQEPVDYNPPTFAKEEGHKEMVEQQRFKSSKL